MPVYRIAQFTVRPEGLATAKAAIAEFVAAVNETERGTRLYLSLQSQAEPTRFTHVMAFEDKAAERKHRASAPSTKFAALVAPLTDTGVEFVPCAPIGMDAPGKTRRAQRKVAKKPQRKSAQKKLAKKLKRRETGTASF